MQVPGFLACALVLGIIILGAGCSSDVGNGVPATPSPGNTPLPVTVPATLPATIPATVTEPATTTASVPSIAPVQVLPRERQVDLALTKDRPTSEIHLLYQGGPGEIFTTRIMMRVYTTDTDYTEYIMSNGAKPIPGDEIVAPGTRGGDRCEVFVISAGTRYRVMDERVYGGMYY